MNREVENFLSSFSYAEQTKASYCRVLEQLVRLDLNQLDVAGLVRFVERPEWGDSMRYTSLCACRKFIRWRYGSEHPALSARVKRTSSPPQPRMSEGQVMDLFTSFDLSTVDGKRDIAIASVALDCNLRATEICNVELGNVYLEQCSLYALVKGGQWAWKTFSPETSGYIREWLSVRSPAVGVQTLFISFHQQRYGEPLRREGLQYIMRKWGERVGFHISPHMFRRTYARLMTLHGAPTKIVQDGGGWKSTRMVEHYIGDLKVEPTRPYLPVKKLHGG